MVLPQYYGYKYLNVNNMNNILLFLSSVDCDSQISYKIVTVRMWYPSVIMVR